MLSGVHWLQRCTLWPPKVCKTVWILMISLSSSRLFKIMIKIMIIQMLIRMIQEHDKIWTRDRHGGRLGNCPEPKQTICSRGGQQGYSSGGHQDDEVNDDQLDNDEC